MAIRKRKSYGQHFLKDPDNAKRIADSVLVSGDCRKVLEIGPGGGMLTQFLVTREDIDLYLCEVDNRWFEFLLNKYPQMSDRSFNKDFLSMDLRGLFENEQFSIVGNFPYQISSQILFKMLDNKDKIPFLVGMFQLEVAERICSVPGSRKYGILSVLTQAFYETELLFKLPPEAFDPPPKVQSAVIRVMKKQDVELGCDEKLFRQVVKKAFNQRRKKLRNAMKGMIEADIPILDKRAEQLSVEDFVFLTTQVEIEKNEREK